MYWNNLDCAKFFLFFNSQIGYCHPLSRRCYQFPVLGTSLFNWPMLAQNALCNIQFFFYFANAVVPRMLAHIVGISNRFEIVGRFHFRAFCNMQRGCCCTFRLNVCLGSPPLQSRWKILWPIAATQTDKCFSGFLTLKFICFTSQPRTIQDLW